MTSYNDTQASPVTWHKPGENEIVICPIGGVRRIGMNMTAYGSAGCYLLVDAGIAFMPPLEAEKTGIRAHSISPETIANMPNLSGIIITHAHEDHIGGVLDLLSEYDLTVYLTPLAEKMLRRKARELRFPYPICTVIFRPGEEFRIGPFLVATCPVSHSIPESCSVFLKADGVSKGVLHTGDYNMDHGNCVSMTDVAWLERLGRSGLVGLAVGDSTNAGRIGSVSEADVAEGLKSVMKNTDGAVYIVSFGSNVCRIINAHSAAIATGRTLAVSGKSMMRMANAARSLGYGRHLPEFSNRCELGAMENRERAMIMTGIQGEPFAALGRMLDGASGYPDFRRGDVVILSGRTLDQNRPAMEILLDRCRQLGVKILEASDTVDGKPLHASGHASRDEIKAYYSLARPEVIMPVHGEPEHLREHAAIAHELDRPSIVPEPGSVYKMTDNGIFLTGKINPIVLSHRDNAPDTQNAAIEEMAE